MVQGWAKKLRAMGPRESVTSVSKLPNHRHRIPDFDSALKKKLP